MRAFDTRRIFQLCQHLLTCNSAACMRAWLTCLCISVFKRSAFALSRPLVRLLSFALHSATLRRKADNPLSRKFILYCLLHAWSTCRNRRSCLSRRCVVSKTCRCLSYMLCSVARFDITVHMSTEYLQHQNAAVRSRVYRQEPHNPSTSVAIRFARNLRSSFTRRSRRFCIDTWQVITHRAR